MHTNVDYLSCGKREALGRFQLPDMRYGDTNMITEIVSKRVSPAILLNLNMLR